MAIVFERLVGRNVARAISEELDLAGVKTSADTFIEAAILGWIAITVAVSFALEIFTTIGAGPALLGGVFVSLMYEVLLYSILELKIEQRKDFVEAVLPDYLQLTSANIRSGISLSRAMIMAVRPEFKYLGDDINILGKQLYSGETLHNAFSQLANRYRSVTLRRTVRIIIEAEQYGGGLADLLNQIAKDLRSEDIVQKEVSGQLFMYTIFIAFAALVGAPTLYALTSQMIKVTSAVWSKISLGSITSVPSFGVSFLKLSKPLITPQAYFYFSLLAIVVIAGFGAFIISAISTGRPLRGLKYLPIFIILGLAIFFVVSVLMGNFFSSFGSL
ncbi:MAG: type II secretion system F family protein [Candidatus Marsarchaeota archaeon]|nr:type II secretion system F family protein [Candidatus Marsarchaeota archaeon]MCL5413019.1 type II secretion system F family protein [Candidatus Marsarchaeota archaeon]